MEEDDQGRTYDVTFDVCTGSHNRQETSGQGCEKEVTHAAAVQTSMEEDNPRSSRKRWDLKRPQSSTSTAAPTAQSTSNSSFLKKTFSQERNDYWASSPALSNYSHSRFETHLENAPWNHSKKSSSDPSFLSNKRPFHVTNSTFSLIQRSDKGKVKDALANIKIAMNVYLESPKPENSLLAFDNLSSLIQYAQDDYYRIVIVNNQGISIIVQAMNVFIEFADLQASACAALISLCQKSERNQGMLITESVGLSCIVEVLERHMLVSFLTNLALEVLNVATSLNPLGIQHLRTKSMSNGASFEFFLRHFPESLLLPEAKNSIQILLSKFSLGNG